MARADGCAGRADPTEPERGDAGDGPDHSVDVLLKLLAFVLPLGVDSFVMAAALGTGWPTRRQRWRLSALFVAFEGGVPLIGRRSLGLQARDDSATRPERTIDLW
jgi:hypothetical protein